MTPHDADQPRDGAPTRLDVNRRSFLKTIGVTSLAATVMTDGTVAAQPPRPAATPGPPTALPDSAGYMNIRDEVAGNLTRLGIVGYADQLRVQPGEGITFMVSSESARFRSDIVRLIHGDPNPKGPGIKEVAIDAPVNREYDGRHQDLPMGSYVTVPDQATLRLTGSFSFTAWIAPTTQRLGPGASLGAEGILTKWVPGQGGYAVVIDETGRLALWLSDAGGRVAKAAADVPLRPWIPAIPGMNQRPQGVATAWYFIAVTFDSSSGQVVLTQDPLNQFPFDATRGVFERQLDTRVVGTNTGPLLMAAIAGAGGTLEGFYNGKLDGPRLYDRALSREDITAVRRDRAPADALAHWDFAADIRSDNVTDRSSRRLHGVAVNLPTRAVTGHNWTAEEMDYKRAPEQYGAIYFHDDDIADAKWTPAFTYQVPASLPSGLYAARLRTATHEDYVPFVVRPKKGAPTRARIALLMPTFSYLAYGGTGTSAFRPLSLYSRHSDGSGVCYSSRLRPLTNMRPKITTNNPWQFMADTHLIDWLQEKQFDVDFLTDEDLHTEGAAVLTSYKVVVTATHPEYYSHEMLSGVRTYLENGGRVMYMGGNGFYWVTPMDPSGRYIEVRRRDGTEHWQGAPGEHFHSVTGESGGLWRFRGLAPQQFFGVGFTAQGFDRNAPFKRMPGSFDPRVSFIFEGIGANELIGNHPSLVLEFGAAGSELDRADFAIGTPPHTLVLASSFGHSDAYQHVVEQNNTANGANPGGTVNPLVRADMVYLEYPEGGAVFSTSSIAWCGSLSFDHYTNNVSRVTENVLRRFASDAPLPSPRMPSGSTQQG